MAVQRLDVAQDLARVLELLGVQHLAAHHEADGAARVQHVAADAAVQVFLARDVGQHGLGVAVGDVAVQHLGADLLQVVVDAFQRVGGVFGIGVEELEQHFLGFFDQTGRAARTQAQQAEDRNVFLVDGKQHAAAFQLGVVLVQDEGHAHAARVVLVVHQEVAADVQLAVVFLIEAGGFLDVLVGRVFGNRQTVVLLDPALFLEGGRLQVDPDGLELLEFFQRFDLFLDQTAIGQRKDIEHAALPNVVVALAGMQGALPILPRRPSGTGRGWKLPTRVGFHGVISKI